MNKFNFLAVFLIILVSGCATPKAPQLTPLEKQILQTREYEETKEIVFPSVLSVLQDSGYIVNAADKDTGLITAESPTDGGALWLPFVGITNTTSQTAVTAFVDQIGPITKVRLNFVIKKSSSSAYGQSSKQDTPILDVTTYQNAFEKIESAIFIRSSN